MQAESGRRQKNERQAARDAVSPAFQPPLSTGATIHGFAIGRREGEAAVDTQFPVAAQEMTGIMRHDFS
jgi:hypothetical protein